MTAKTSRILHTLLFVSLFLFIAAKYDYLDILQYGPISTHQWRQSDSAALAMYYYHNGLNFFQPGTYFLNMSDGEAVGEFPIIYYCAAVLYKLFGPHDFILRGLNLLIFILGLYAFSRMLHGIYGHWAAAAIVPFLLMGSLVIAYYSPNFIPNAPALGIALGAMYYYYRYYQTRLSKYFLGAAILFLLAGLIKITSLIIFVAFFGLFLFSKIPVLGRKIDPSLFPPASRLIAVYAINALLILVWVLWAKSYNAAFHTGLFLADINPIWETAPARIEYTYMRIYLFIHNYFFSAETASILGLIILSLVFFVRKISLAAYLLLLFTFLGSLLYLLLFYKQLSIHNYYFVDVMIFPLLAFSMFVYGLLQLSQHRLYPYLIAFAVFCFVSMSWNRTYFDLSKLFEPDFKAMQSFNPSLYQKKALQAFLIENGVQQTDRIISLPDTSPNNSLYYLDRKGWTQVFRGDFTIRDFRKVCAMNAQYLVLTDSTFLKGKDFTPLLPPPLAVFDESVFLYNLQGINWEERD